MDQSRSGSWLQLADDDCLVVKVYIPCFVASRNCSATIMEPGGDGVSHIKVTLADEGWDGIIAVRMTPTSVACDIKHSVLHVVIMAPTESAKNINCLLDKHACSQLQGRFWLPMSVKWGAASLGEELEVELEANSESGGSDMDG